VRRPRIRTPNGTAEVAVPAYEAFASADLLEGMVLEKMLGKHDRRARSAGHGAQMRRMGLGELRLLAAYSGSPCC
ncbi:hypothetical protein ACFQ07_17590, partial [Actinomadura adrarensis]